MRSFLGVPVMTRGVAFGNLYLAEKQPAGRFTEEDEEVDDLARGPGRRRDRERRQRATRRAASCGRRAGGRAASTGSRVARRNGTGAHVDSARSLRGRAGGDRGRCPRARQRRCGSSSSTRCRTSVDSPWSCARRHWTTSGSSPALQRLAQTTREGGALNVQVEARLGSDRLPADVETAVYRIVQEAITNVVKHAAARSRQRRRDAERRTCRRDDRGRRQRLRSGCCAGRWTRAARDARARRAPGRVARRRLIGREGRRRSASSSRCRKVPVRCAGRRAKPARSAGCVASECGDRASERRSELEAVTGARRRHDDPPVSLEHERLVGGARVEARFR